jgi:hypothetical protein
LSLLLATSAGGAAADEDALERYRSLARPAASEKSANSASSRVRSAFAAKPGSRDEFHERISPYLSSGAYAYLVRRDELSGRAATPLAGEARAPTPEGPNRLVNDPTGEDCFFSGCTQNEPSIAAFGTDIVIGFNDSKRSFDGTIDSSGYSYSVDGGLTWTDGGTLPLRGGGDALLGDPAVVFCDGSFYYASLYRTPAAVCSSQGGAFVAETEPNDGPDSANQIELGDDYAGAILPPSDVDYVSFFAPAGTVIQAATVLGTLTDSTLQLFDVDGTTSLAFNDDFNGLASQINFVIPADGTYYLAVRSFGAFLEGTYTLQVRSCTGPSVRAGVSAVSVSRGTVSGPALSWDPPVVVAFADDAFGFDFLDREHIACDPSSGALYVSYTRFPFGGSGRGRIDLVGSNDGGLTWSSPSVVEPEDPISLNQGSVPAVGPGHEVYVAWQQGGQGTSPTGKPTIQLRKSIDGGSTFPTRTTVADFVETAFVPPAGLTRIADFPSMAVDRSAGPNRGNVYVVFEEGDRDVRDIKLARSTTGGLSFETAVRVNDDPPGADQFFPWVAVDPVDGQISVISYDRRRNPGTALTDVFLTQSYDGGQVFIPGISVTDRASDFAQVVFDVIPNFGDYINVATDGTAVYAAWADARNGDPDVFFSRIAKDTGPFVLLQGFSIDDSHPDGDGDGTPEPGESPRLKIALVNAGAGAARHVSATLSTATPGVTVVQPAAAYADLSNPGSSAVASLYQFSVDPSLLCSRTVVCQPMTTQLYGVDPGGTIVRFAFDTGASASVPTPGDTPSGGPDGLAVQTATDAFWVDGFGLDQIFEFNPVSGALIPGPFPVPSPGFPGCTDGLAMVAPGRLFTQNYCEGKLYEIDSSTGLVANASLPGGLGLIGGLAGGNGRLFATVGFTTIAELDPNTALQLNSFPAPDLNADGFADSIYGLGFDGTHLFAASVSAAPPNVMALDPATGRLLAVSPFTPPSGSLSALDAVAGAPGNVCMPGTFRTTLDFDLAIDTDQGPFFSSFSVPLGREAKTTAFRDDVESGVDGWTATGQWHLATDRSASSTHAWYFGTEIGAGLADNAYADNAAGNLISPPIDLSGGRSAELVFDHYLGRELCCDFATVSASNDGFATSTVLASLAPALDPAFSEVRLDLSAFAGSPRVQVRFSFTSDASVAFEGWYLDNIRVEQMTFDCQRDSAGSATTPTTLPAARTCRVDADCSDGKACTTDQCADGECLHAAITGFAGAECELAQALTCDAEPIDARLARVISMRLEKARTLVHKAAERSRSRRQANTLIRRAERKLSGVSKASGKAARKRRISRSCQIVIDQRISELRRAISGLRT